MKFIVTAYQKALLDQLMGERDDLLVVDKLPEIEDSADGTRMRMELRAVDRDLPPLPDKKFRSKNKRARREARGWV